MTRGTAGRGEDGNNARQPYCLPPGDSEVLSTSREQKYLLHHRSHCRYRHRPQSAPRVLASRLDVSRRVNRYVRVWIALGSEDTFFASKN